MTEGRNKLLWGMQITLAVALTAMGIIPKLISDPEMVANFARWGYPEGFHFVIAAGEITAVTLLLIPRTVILGAGVLASLMLGAIGTHLMHSEFGMALVPLSMLTAAVWIGLQRWNGSLLAPVRVRREKFEV
jgi:uncharacterized membrane protein YphA (DoxX/SURF4 family)